MKRGETFIDDGFRLTESTLAWIAEKYPTVDVPETVERFTDNAAAKSWAYRDWQAAFRNYVRNGPKFGGVAYKSGVADDPRWRPILQDARKFGFREPTKVETPAGYKTALEQWKRQPKTNVVNFSGVLKKVV